MPINLRSKKRRVRFPVRVAAMAIAWAAALFGAEAARAEGAGLSLAGRAGTPGFGLELSKSVTPRVNLRCGLNLLGYNRDLDADLAAGSVAATIHFDGELRLKTVGLLANCLAKQQASEAGAYEAWLVDGDGYVTEGSSTNAWIVDGDGRAVTHPLGPDILPGITRAAVLRLARTSGVAVVERPFTVAEAKSAREAFLTSTTSFVRPVVRIDDTIVGNGEPGSVTRTLLGGYLAHMIGEGLAA